MKRLDNYRLIPHAKQRLFERFGVSELPNIKVEFLKRLTWNRTLCKAGEIYFIRRKSDKTIITILTEGQLKKRLFKGGKK